MRGTGTLSAWLGALLLAALAAHAQAPAESDAGEAKPPAAAGAAEGETHDAAAAEKPADANPKAATPKAIPMADLRALMKREIDTERAANKERLERFRKAKAEQEQLLADAKVTLAREEAASDRLETQYNENEATYEHHEARLEERLGQLGELFGVVRQVSTDAGGNMWASITSAELGQRKELLDRLGRSKELPSTLDLEDLWYELQREMTAQGKVVSFPASVLTRSGEVVEEQVTRIGPFAAIAKGGYLKWKPEEGKLTELKRQPPERYVETVASYQANKAGYAGLAIDPSRGALMEALTETPYFLERIDQGGVVGYVIIGLAAVALLIGAIRWVAVTIISRRVAAQQKRTSARLDNPLGRVLSVYEDNQDMDPEHLELKLDDVVLKESAKLTRLLWLVQTVSIVAPLLGLLGTVTGMIQTFQAITLYGTGDPKVMAGGISEALVTTMLGLYAAIPLVLIYGLLSSTTRRILNVLDEKVTHLVAIRTEAGAGHV